MQWDPSYTEPREQQGEYRDGTFFRYDDWVDIRDTTSGEIVNFRPLKFSAAVHMPLESFWQIIPHTDPVLSLRDSI